MKKVLASFSMLTLLATMMLTLPPHQQARAQSNGATLVQHSATMLQAATKVTSVNLAINTAITTQLTMTPSAGNYVYITAMDLTVCQNNTGLAQTNVAWQFTQGISPSGTVPIWQYSTALSVNSCIFKIFPFTVPLKSISPGTAVILTSAAADAQAAYNGNVYWYEAP